jgi:hypothetical protein
VQRGQGRCVGNRAAVHVARKNKNICF